MSGLEKGTVLGGTYEIIEEIGSGGGGVVFLARHLRLQNDVVVKKIKDDVLGRVESRKEADILKNLKHPYLPRVYDFIETDAGIYTVMDYIKGNNLEHAVKNHGKYSQKQVKKWAQQLGEALDYLHSQNPPIIHSDIKPANIMLTEDGDVCLIDFNISLAMGESIETAVGISAGFSPPEQYRDPVMYERITRHYTLQKSQKITVNQEKRIREKKFLQTEEDDRTEILHLENDDRTEVLKQPIKTGQTSSVQGDTEHLSEYIPFFGKGISTSSDIYSLGVTLYYLLTGKEPPIDFKQRTPISETGVQVSEGFAVILEKMMALSPQERYADGKEYLKAICNCHKLDRRYILMHRKQNLLQIAAVGSLTIGIILIFSGLYMIQVEKNAVYYDLVKNAKEAANLGEYADAVEALAQAKSMYDVRIEAYEEELHILYLQGEYEECIKQGESCINTVPFEVSVKEDEESYANLFYIIGNAYYEIADYSNAEKYLKTAIEKYDQNGLYYRDYAVTLAKLGRMETAQAKLEQGISLGLGQDSIYMAQGEIAHMKGENKKAEEYLLQTIATTEDIQLKKRAVLFCVEIYKFTGEVDAEIALLEKTLEESTGNEEMVISEYLADAYARKAQMGEQYEQEYYTKSLSIFSSLYERGFLTYQLQENMAILYENLDRFEEAETLLLEMAERYPDRYEVYKRLAYLEADWQQEKENADRNYLRMRDFYELAKEKYPDDGSDMDMEMLDQMIQELADGGWL